MHELDPLHAPKAGSLSHDKHQEALRIWLETQPGLVAEIARDEVAEIIAVTEVIKVLKRRIAARVRVAAPSLLTLHGCAALTAAKLVGETAGIARFRNEAAFARHAGVAPVPHSSGPKTVRIKAGKGGNRKINAALYRIAMIQIRHGAPGEAYYRARRETGDTHAEAIRRVERRIVRRVFRLLQHDQPGTDGTDGTARLVSNTHQLPANIA